MKQGSFEIRRPCAELALSFERMRDAVILTGLEAWIAPGTSIAMTDVNAYVTAAARWASGEDVPSGWVPFSTFWIVQGGEVVGELSVRHRLNDRLHEIGGHIGYLTHPQHRNKGIATFALRNGLKMLAASGATEAIVTCLESNAASIRVIEKCGGRRIEDARTGPKRRRYTFDLSEI